MIWPLGAELSIEVRKHAPRILRQGLHRNGFQTDGQQCSALLDLVGGFLNYVCEAFNSEIASVLGKYPGLHSPQDLVSWVVGDLDQYFSYALQKFQGRLVDHISIDLGGGRPITCAEALTGSDWLPEIYVEAAAAWQAANYEAPISSARFRRKRAQHQWTPRSLDLSKLVRSYFQ